MREIDKEIQGAVNCGILKQRRKIGIKSELLYVHTHIRYTKVSYTVLLVKKGKKQFELLYSVLLSLWL